MKHARKDYDRIQDSDELIPDNEPVFLLRGQDVLAPELLRQWAVKLLLRGGSGIMAEMVINHAKEMEEWQENHKRKLPDLPIQ